jgi:hypothetical protein
MRFKKIRIVVSVSCGMLCLLLVGLWVRSQSTLDEVQFRINARWSGQVGSVPGSVDAFVSNKLIIQESLKLRSLSRSNLHRSSVQVSGIWGRFNWSS